MSVSDREDREDREEEDEDDELSDRGFVIDDEVAEAEDVGDAEPSDGESLSSSDSQGDGEDNVYHPRVSMRKSRARAEEEQHEADAQCLAQCKKQILKLHLAIGSGPLSEKQYHAIQELERWTQQLDVNDAPRPAKMLRYDDDDDDLRPTKSDHAILLQLVTHIRTLYNGPTRQGMLLSESDEACIRSMKQIVK
jgi:hypothetical protein